MGPIPIFWTIHFPWDSIVKHLLPFVLLVSSLAMNGIARADEAPNVLFVICDDLNDTIVVFTGEEELYDHQSAPHEWHNLAGKSEHSDVQKRLRTLLLEQSGQRD